MKIKIVEPGNESFTGQLGNVQFADGVSVADVTHAEATAIAAIFRCEWVLQGDEPIPEAKEQTTPEENAPEQPAAEAPGADQEPA